MAEKLTLIPCVPEKVALEFTTISAEIAMGRILISNAYYPGLHLPVVPRITDAVFQRDLKMCGIEFMKIISHGDATMINKVRQILTQ
jgi:hypothetical protein